MRLVSTTGIFLMIMAAQQPAQSAKNSHVWKTAKVMAVTPAKNYVEEMDRRGERTTVTIQDTLIILENDEFSYIVTDTQKSGSIPLHHGAIGDIQAIKDASHRSCRFIVNDNVQFYQDKRTLHVLDADHQECKVNIFVQAALTERGRKDLSIGSGPSKSSATDEDTLRTLVVLCSDHNDIAQAGCAAYVQGFADGWEAAGAGVCNGSVETWTPGYVSTVIVQYGRDHVEQLDLPVKKAMLNIVTRFPCTEHPAKTSGN